MKPEQIERLLNLERRAMPAPWVVRPQGVASWCVGPKPAIVVSSTREEAELLAAMRNALPRLIEERKILLEALQFALSEESGFACPTYAEDRLRHAIASAEADPTDAASV